MRQYSPHIKTETYDIDQLSITTIRTLSIDAIEKSKSGHPGMPMGAAPMAYQLFAKTMVHNPDRPKWINRDRFVLSAGHGSMLLYSLLHLSGYDLSMEQLQQFRQWGSKTPGHPEYGHTPGVDATTGPLGQGLGMAVGMAMAEVSLATTYNRDHFDIINHRTYVICGDGDLMEGVSHEVASLAGKLGLGKLIVLFDSNDITLDGHLNLSCSEMTTLRFEAYGWQVLRVEDGNNLEAIAKAIDAAQQEQNRPTLIEIKTIIGYGSPTKQGKGGHEGTHGSPLGEEEVKLTKQFYKWDVEEPFHVPQIVREHFAQIKCAGVQETQAWDEKFAQYERAHPQLALQFNRAMNGILPSNWTDYLPKYDVGHQSLSTRVASGHALNALAPHIPYIMGGSADLESSTMTHLHGLGQFCPENYAGRNIYFGIREFGMATAMNGMALHGGIRVFGGTFFVFTDYLRPAVRLAALMSLPVIYVLTHDSIAVGEDGPTHEPVEQLASLRVIPNLTVIRPADANETAGAWAYAMDHVHRPIAIVLGRQNVPILNTTVSSVREGVQRGAYVVCDKPKPAAMLLATGSEVQLCLEAQAILEHQGIPVRVVSMPSWDLFERQDEQYKESVLLPKVKARLAVEMASPMGWEKYVGDHGDVIGISTFGASAPGTRIVKEYGFTVEHIIARLKALL